MSDQFVGEIRVFSLNFAPNGWAFCNGQLLPISQFQALFSLLGTNFGGDGRTSFGLPNLQGCVPLAWGQGPGLTDRDLGESSGATMVTLSSAQVPSHTHALQANALEANLNAPAATNSLARSKPAIYIPPTGTPPVPPTLTPLAAGTMGPAIGGNQPHNNLQPYLALNFCIALQGVFPPRD